MTLLDAYALIAYFKDEPAAAQVESLLADGDCAITSVNLAEVIDVLVRMVGLEFADVVAAVSQLGLAHVEIRAEAGIRAGRMRSIHYRKRTCEVSLGDCVLAAVCGDADRIATSDPALASVLRAESLGLIPLPDSSGALP